MKAPLYLSKIIFIIFIFPASLLSALCKKNSQKTIVTIPPPDTLTYQLVWSDEFDGTGVNTANWNFETGGSGWGNHEKEYYQAVNASVSKGNLVITAKKENVNFNNYTSTRITTLGKREFTFGKIEARIMIPIGQGLWPAFWLLGTNINSVGWPACGETDIMEHINADNLIYGTLHWNNNGHVSNGGNTPAASPADYHIYAVEWDSSAIRWYLDGVKYHEVNILNNINSTEEFQKPFYIILNLAVGGDWPGQTIDDSKFPASMYVNYVRVYQKK
jgi:beta-glucanase (GH16 family)